MLKNHLKALVAILLSGISICKAQTIYYTDFGTTQNVNPPGWTFSGVNMNISNNTPSTGYPGVSGGCYLGEGNSVAFVNTFGNAQPSSQIGTSVAELTVSTMGFPTVILGFGMRKSSATYNSNATYTLEWSPNGSTYFAIPYTEATAGNWGLATGAGLTLPAGAGNIPTLYIRWTFARTGTSSNFKIDDVSLTAPASPATISFLSNDSTVAEASGNASMYLKLTSSSTASCSVNISAAAVSNASASDYTLATTTVTFAANATVNSTAPIVLNINNDAIAESSEYIILKMSSPVNASVGTVTQCAVYIKDDDKVIPSPANTLSLNLLASFSNTVAGSNSAEIVSHDPTTQRLYIANSVGAKLDVVNFVNPSSPTLLATISVTPYGNINSVAVRNGIVACAIENGTNPQDTGKIVFFDKDGNFLKQVKAGAMPDMICFNHAGNRVITANEGEPNAAYTQDPEGSVTIVDLSGGIAALTQSNVTQVMFTSYNGQEATLKAQGIRIYGGPSPTASKDFEPEYVTVSKDDSKAWVTLQENNAIVEINLTTNTITAIRALGTKNHMLLNNGMDLSNMTKKINITNFPVKGFYLPDAIASYTVGGVNYLVTANEGDTRAYSGFTEETRVKNLILDPIKFPNAAELKNDYTLGRLTVTDKFGDIDSDGDIDTIYSIGARSFSIWNGVTGQLVYDSGDDFEQITASNSFSVMFNASNAGSAAAKDRSDDKGPEPEGIAIGVIGANTYAFIALERIGGVMVYDITNPNAPFFVTYVNNRSFSTNGPDRGAEGIIFIPQSQSPNGQHIVIAANEISSTLSIWGIPGCSAPISSSLSIAGSTVGCTGTTTLSVPTGGGLTYQWSVNSSTITGATSNTVVAYTSGNYMVAINGGSNCSTSSLSQSVTVNPSPTVTAVTSNSLLCIGQTATITASGAATYTWNTSASTTAIAVSPTTTTNYTVMGTGSNSCIASVAITQSVSTCSDIEELSSSHLVSIYPNPAHDKVMLEINNGGSIAIVELYSILGEKVFETPVEDTTRIEIGLSSFAKGLYFIKTTIGKDLTISKLVIE